MDKYPSHEEIGIANDIVKHYPKYPLKKIPFVCQPNGVIIVPTRIYAEIHIEHCYSDSGNDSE